MNYRKRTLEENKTLNSKYIPPSTIETFYLNKPYSNTHESRNIHVGDIVQHFKRGSNKDNSYLYRICHIAYHTENNEKLVIYQALYSPFKTYARPYNMFFGEVDKKKYPYIEQKYRFEKYVNAGENYE